MSFQEFDTAGIDQYAAEVKERWGSTQAYQESRERTARYTKADFAAQNEAMTAIFARFGALRRKDPAEAEVQSLVAEWRQFITDHYYTCTKEILAGLGRMYTADERFRENLDRNGKGTAEFMSRAIAIYCE